MVTFSTFQHDLNLFSSELFIIYQEFDSFRPWSLLIHDPDPRRPPGPALGLSHTTPEQRETSANNTHSLEEALGAGAAGGANRSRITMQYEYICV